MSNKSLYFSIALLATIIATIYGCKKVSSFDNGQVIETPFSLYFADSAGGLYNSNDGQNFVMKYAPDGSPSRALITSGSNILWVKSTLLVSSNNGLNFNQAYQYVQFATNIAPWDGKALNGYPIDLNQSMMVSVPGTPNLDYLTTYLPAGSGAGNYLGVDFNNEDGASKYWSQDDNYDTTVGATGYMPVDMTSMVLMPNGYLLGLTINPLPDGVNFRNFYNTDPSNYNTIWTECTGNNGGIPVGGGNDTGGNSLPPNAAYPDDTPFFTLGNYNARAIAIDERGKDGAWYSDDNGHSWYKYSGLPVNTPLLCIGTAFNQICMIGTDSAGLYFLNETTNTWQQNTNGLPANLVIKGIAAKENVYKDNSTIQYIFLATNRGIYESKDMGLHWTQTIKGNYVNIY